MADKAHVDRRHADIRFVAVHGLDGSREHHEVGLLTQGAFPVVPSTLGASSGPQPPDRFRGPPHALRRSAREACPRGSPRARPCRLREASVGSSPPEDPVMQPGAASPPSRPRTAAPRARRPMRRSPDMAATRTYRNVRTRCALRMFLPPSSSRRTHGARASGTQCKPCTNTKRHPGRAPGQGHAVSSCWEPGKGQQRAKGWSPGRSTLVNASC